MKIRYIPAVYTLVMGVLLFSILAFFGRDTDIGRDMVFYNEQRHLAEGAVKEGKDRQWIQEVYRCEILFVPDRDYEVKLCHAQKREALIFDYMEDENLAGKIIFFPEENRYQKLERDMKIQSLMIFLLQFFLGYLLLGILYVQLIRPFLNLQKFARQIAKGNLDFPLPVRKHNYFGAFTESFDIMREELKRARESEFCANQSKKELMAELSHDIKTPVAAIRAACEVAIAMETQPGVQKKIRIIDNKAKVIDELVGNLFHATLEELVALKVEPLEESSLCMMDMFLDLQEYGQISFVSKIPECMVYMDKLRLSQVIDNCINNGWKYAGTQMLVEFLEDEGGIRIRIRDKGKGVPEEDLPRIAEKFYRGSNAKGKEGSGLGLYLAKIFMEQMQGGMEYYNQEGFVVELFLKKV
ncbi:MAG: HAMP domain-containing histidine kinase [Lachnospiraceae bacterium]|nr:HAMP domain-containing histidine kinase [Lachnospiraceae bacterium]MDE6980668.1 HAMP domain-containing histidine kinase [Lachnospiraceae bacterium]